MLLRAIFEQAWNSARAHLLARDSPIRRARDNSTCKPLPCISPIHPAIHLALAMLAASSDARPLHQISLQLVPPPLPALTPLQHPFPRVPTLHFGSYPTGGLPT